MLVRWQHIGLLGSVLALIAGCATIPSVPPRESSRELPRRRFARRVALVLGNSRYVRATALPRATDDARLVASSLQRIGFHVTLRIDTDRVALIRAVRGFARDLARNDLALVFYAGHGVSVAGRNYLLPVEFDTASEEELTDHVVHHAVALEELSRPLQARGATHVLVLDACRISPWGAEDTSQRLGYGDLGVGLASTQGPAESVVVFANAPGRVTEDERASRSPFSMAFARHVVASVPLGEMLRRVRVEVLQATRDRQWVWQHEALTHTVTLRREWPLPEVHCPEGMAAVPEGSLEVGSQDASDVRARRSVLVPAFCMDRTEVTVDAYQRCVEAGGCSPAPATVRWAGYADADLEFWSSQCNAAVTGRGDHPINCVDADLAQTYCAWRAARLPSEHEWEYAATVAGGVPRLRPWGIQPPSAARLNLCGVECARWALDTGRTWSTAHAEDDGYASTAPADSFPEGRTPLGLLHMAGNVHEWTASPLYADGSDGGQVMLSAGVRALRVVRGGGWIDANPRWADASARGAALVSGRYVDVGFRCAQ